MAKLLSTDFATLLKESDGRASIAIGNNTDARIGYRDNIMVPSRVEISIHLYGTPIVKLYPNDDMAFSLGGFPTTTTKERVNQFLSNYNYKVVHDKRTLYLVNLSNNTRESINDTDWYSIWRSAKVV